MEVLQAYSSKGRHYETRFDKILETANRSAAVRKPLKPKAKLSAKIVHRLTAIEQADIAARYQQGWSSRRLAEVHGVSKTSIIQLLRDAGIAIRHQGLTIEQAREAVHLYGTGRSLAQIGEQFDVSPGCVRQRLAEQDVRIRRPWSRAQ